MCYRFAEAYRGHHRSKNHRRRERRHWKSQWAQWATQAPVNIKEFDDRYELYLYAAGLKKSDFQVFISDHVLNIVVEEVEPEAGEEQFRWRRQEYRPGNIKRQFELNESVNVESIDAEYSEGVLRLTLHKLEDYHTPRQDILVD
ncbi:MAG: Hsp20/alpha crystallin family protein [Bacteroidota bacterium]